MKRADEDTAKQIHKNMFLIFRGEEMWIVAPCGQSGSALRAKAPGPENDLGLTRLC